MGRSKKALPETICILKAEFGKGFTVTNLKYMRQFYLAFPVSHALRDQLSWTHYRLLEKVGKLNHQDIGQMDFYVRYFEKEVKTDSDNPTIGIILSSQRNEAVVKYSVLEESKQIFSAKYLPYLPTEEELKKELKRERNFLEMEKALQE